MRKTIGFFSCFLALPLFSASYYGTGLCSYSQYECIRTNRGDTWQRLFPDEVERDIVQRINRTSDPLWHGKEIAVPKDIKNKTLLDFSPFPRVIQTDHQKQVIIDQDKLAWAAYDEKGHLVNWGPISSGRDKCSDSNRSCRTMTGIFYFFSKENEKCRSNLFPVGRGGARMPWCMYYHKGFALHGSESVPGYRASHGCVRLFPRDALWLNQQFVVTRNEEIGEPGTKIIVRPVNSTN